MPEPEQAKPAETMPARIERLLEKRPPLPPDPVDVRWAWTRPKLKAVYLEAFTQMSKAEMSTALEISPTALYKWRRAPDYRRYLATLIAADGLADRAERVKARKNLAETLGKAISEKMRTPGALAGEKLSSLLRAQREMLDALQDDAEELRELGAEQDSAARAGQARPALDLGERLATITDPHERDIVKKHLLALMSEYMDAPRIIDAAPVVDAESGAVAEASARELAPSAPESSGQDLDAFTEADATEPARPAISTPSEAQNEQNLSADDFAEG